MKKSMLIGAAALATLAMAPQASDAGEVTLGGYYKFDAMISQDARTLVHDNNRNKDDQEYYWHRLELKMDMKVSDKTHAHAVFRPVGGSSVQGADRFPADHSARVETTASADQTWRTKKLWLETEAFGIGVKAGEMPIKLNDKILVNSDDDSYGALMLSKTFSGVTVVLADVKVSEGNPGQTASAGAAAAYAPDSTADDDDVDAYVLALLGKVGGFDYNFTLAYADAGECSIYGGGTTATCGTAVSNPLSVTSGQDTSNLWAGLTVSGDVGPVNLTGSLLYEDGYDNTLNTTAFSKQAGESDIMVALRAKSKVGFGEVRGYAFYGGEDFNSIADKPDWSFNYDQLSSGVDLMSQAISSTTTWGIGDGGDSSSNTYGDGSVNVRDSENLMGAGIGMTINAGAWKIMPEIDYVQVADETVSYRTAANVAMTDKVNVDSAWGGSLRLQTNLEKGMSLTIAGSVVEPNYNGRASSDSVDGTTQTNVSDNTMHAVGIDLKMTF